MAVCLFGVSRVHLNRKDLTHLKVYAIDVDEADEVIVTWSFLEFAAKNN